MCQFGIQFNEQHIDRSSSFSFSFAGIHCSATENTLFSRMLEILSFNCHVCVCAVCRVFTAVQRHKCATAISNFTEKDVAKINATKSNGVVNTKQARGVEKHEKKTLNIFEFYEPGIEINTRVVRDTFPCAIWRASLMYST